LVVIDVAEEVEAVEEGLARQGWLVLSRDFLLLPVCCGHTIARINNTDAIILNSDCPTSKTDVFRPRVYLLTDSYYPVVGGGEAHARLLCGEIVAEKAGEV